MPPVGVAHLRRCNAMTPSNSRSWHKPALDVDPAEFWLEPDETIEGTARIRADRRVAIEGDDVLSPVISLEAQAAQGDTWVPFGGISGTAHAVRRAKLEIDVTRGEELIDVSGYASTEVDVIREDCPRRELVTA